MPEKAYGKKTSATALRPRNEAKVTCWPNWSRSVKSGATSPTQWFQDRAVVDVLDPSDGEPLDDGEVTRAEDKIAVVRGPNTTASSAPTMVRVYAVSSLSARPTERCDLRAAPNSRIESPTWSPSGRRLAWSERDGIWSSPIASGTGDCAAAPKLLIRGGSQPDWGPADR